MPTCRQWREGDENVCSCGLRWDTNEPDPHPSEEEKRQERNRRNIEKIREELNKPAT